MIYREKQVCFYLSLAIIIPKVKMQNIRTKKKNNKVERRREGLCVCVCVLCVCVVCVCICM